MRGDTHLPMHASRQECRSILELKTGWTERKDKLNGKKQTDT